MRKGGSDPETKAKSDIDDLVETIQAVTEKYQSFVDGKTYPTAEERDSIKKTVQSLFAQYDEIYRMIRKRFDPSKSDELVEMLDEKAGTLISPLQSLAHSVVTSRKEDNPISDGGRRTRRRRKRFTKRKSRRV